MSHSVEHHASPVKPTLLLAEDDDELRWALARVLRELGWDVHEVANGAALLEVLGAAVFEKRAPPPDVVVTDIRMPGFNGLSIIEGLRDLGWTTPVVVMSAYGDPEIRARVQGFVAAGYVDKPVDPTQLDRTLRGLLKNSAAASR